jgi:hypothetical protein
MPFVVLLSVSHTHHPDNSIGAFLAIVAFCLCLAVPGLFLARRLSNAGVWIGADGIVVRNPVRTIPVPLRDAESFVPGVASGGGNGTPCPILKRKHGRPVGVWALGREGVVWRFGRYQHEMEPLCDQLNTVLRTLQAGK